MLWKIVYIVTAWETYIFNGTKHSAKERRVTVFPPGLKKGGGGGWAYWSCLCLGTYIASLYYYPVLREHGKKWGAVPPRLGERPGKELRKMHSLRGWTISWVGSGNTGTFVWCVCKLLPHIVVVWGHHLPRTSIDLVPHPPSTQHVLCQELTHVARTSATLRVQWIK